MNVLVTGASGFVGRSLLPYLKSNEINCKSVGRSNSDILLSELSSSHLMGSSSLIHLAGKAHDLKKTSDDSEYFEVNTNLTISLYDEFLKSDCSNFIYISSVKAVADEVNGVLDEDVNPNPVTVYGRSKLKAEQYIMANMPNNGKRVFILRPCMIHGPGNKGNLNLLYSLINKGIPYPLACYENKRSFLSVENLCYVINQIIRREDISSGVYNVADDISISTNDLVTIISQVLNKKPSLLKVPKSLIKFISKIGNYLPLPLNEEKVQKLTEDYVVSNRKITSALGNSLPVTTHEGLKTTISSFKDTIE